MSRAVHKDGVNQHGVIIDGVEDIFEYKNKRVELIIEAVKYRGFWCYGYTYNRKDKPEGSGKSPNVRDVKHKFNRDDLIQYVFNVHSHNFSDKEFTEMRGIAYGRRVQQLELFL